MPNLDRVFVIGPIRPEGGPGYLQKLFAGAGRPIPAALEAWDEQVDTWCAAYRESTLGTNIVETNIDSAVFLFDLAQERVVLAYALSTPAPQKKDTARMRGFSDVNVGVRAVMGERAFLADRGHFLGHASGGVLDINLFPHRRELNRGWTKGGTYEEGSAFRAMERYVAAHPGVFFYHRPLYDDDTWIPERLEYGYLEDDGLWRVRTFADK